jgi:hypothetical protein
MLKNISAYPWHVLLFASYPILSLLANNITQVDHVVVYRSLVLSLVISLLLLMLAKWLLRDWQKAGLLVTAVNILFFSYGHVYSFLQQMEIAGVAIGRHRVLAVLWVGLLVLLLVWIVKGREFQVLTSSLNSVVALLLVFPLYTLVSFGFSGLNINQTKLSEVPALANLKSSPDSPDVYFFILDQYARSDVLAEYFKYDNSDFINGLNELGFYVASCSQSNYPYTTASLAATLNVDYISNLGEDFNPTNKSYRPMQQAIKNSRVETAFRNLGYQIIAFETGYHFTEWEDADIFYQLSSNRINNFEALLLRSSATLLAIDLGLFDLSHLTDDERKRERILFVLDRLEEIPSLPGKKFVFVHLVVPHPPFVFGPSGEFQVIHPFYENGEAGYRREDFRRGYRNQAIFISSKLLGTINKIITNSAQTPVIIIQGDHGPITIPDEKRMNILNAYLFPGSNPDFYPTITPVNNFRLVFNHYFNGSFPLIPDRSFDVDITQPHVFDETQNTCTVSE